jgi:type IV secretory pathway VirB2 component (pilin)
MMAASPNAAGDGAIASAVGWLQGVLLGNVAIAVATIAVASIGFLMLTGRIDLRRAGQVIIGCFILFGASSIARGIVSAANGSGVIVTETAQAYYPPAPPSYPQVEPKPYDPYAGAALAPR